MAASSSRSLVRHPGCIIQPSILKNEIRTGKIVNLPNLLGILRLLLLIPLALTLRARPDLAVVFGAGAYCLDALDGRVARSLKQETMWGKLWDGFLDKVSLGLVLLLCLQTGLLPVWACALITSYHVVMIAGTCVLLYRGLRQPDGRSWGALANLLLGTAILLRLLGYSLPGQHVLLASLAASVLLLGDYILQILQTLRSRQRSADLRSCKEGKA